METSHYVEQLREDGSIRLPVRIRQKLGLRRGDRVEVIISPSNGGKRSRRKPATEMSESRQKRMEELLFRHREGELTAAENVELESLVLEAQLLTVEKAKQKIAIVN